MLKKEYTPHILMGMTNRLMKEAFKANVYNRHDGSDLHHSIKAKIRRFMYLSNETALEENKLTSIDLYKKYDKAILQIRLKLRNDFPVKERVLFYFASKIAESKEERVDKTRLENKARLYFLGYDYWGQTSD
jgi:hypothetical protein